MTDSLKRLDGSRKADRCNLCGRRWNRAATEAMRAFYPDALVCEHPGKCKAHPEGERCQYLYGLVPSNFKTGRRYYMCGLRL